MRLRPDLTNDTARTPRLRLGCQINVSDEALHALVAAHPGVPLRELVPPVPESSITLTVAPGWRAIYALTPDADGAPVVTGVRFESESGTRPLSGMPATARRQAVTNAALVAARELFDHLCEQGGAGAAERHGFDLSVAAGRLVPDSEYALVASVFVEVVASGSRNQLVETAERLGLTREQVRHRVRKARDRDLLDGDKLTERGRRARGVVPEKAARRRKRS